jgi:hypothetical protein
MDELDRLVNLYHSRASSSVKSRLDVMFDIERVRDDRVVPFLLGVLADRHESADVRIYLVKRMRNPNAFIPPTDRPLVAESIGDVLTDESNLQLRLQAALTLGDFTDIDGVLSRLTALSLVRDESIDLRYAAFTSIERAGPTPECIGLMQQIASDGALGGAARSVLSAWHVR